ncbi:MAG: hypothetical protein ACJAUD_002906 [Crocinitomicaceae bacterium]|jgi:hypothetical protein
MLPKLIVSFLALSILYSCSESEKRQESSSKKEVKAIAKKGIPTYDTIVLAYEQDNFKTNPISSDTTFLINGEPHTLLMKLELNGNDTVYCDESDLKNDTILVTCYTGNNIKYLFRLYDSGDNELWEKVFYKKEYIKELGGIVIQSNMMLPEFETYLESTKQIVLTQNFGIPQSDVGVEGILKFNTNGDCEIKFHRWGISSAGECEVQYSQDSSCLLTCSEIITSKGKKISLIREGATIAGNMFIGESHVFVSYDFNSKRTELQGRLYNTSGKIVKEFEFEGYSGALSYTIPVVHLNKFGLYYFVDQPNECFHIIPENSPTSIKKVPFSSIRLAPKTNIHDSILEISTEVSEHRFGINARGEIVAHQMKHYGDAWSFYDEIEY